MQFATGLGRVAPDVASAHREDRLPDLRTPAPSRRELRLLREQVWTATTGTTRRPELRARATSALRFGLVGTSGIVVNEAALATLVSVAGLNYIVGYLLATQCSTLWNFAFIETWVFKSSPRGNRRWQRFVSLMVMNNVANVLTAPIYVAMTAGLGLNYLVSNIVTLAMIFVARFTIAERIWTGSARA